MKTYTREEVLDIARRAIDYSSELSTEPSVTAAIDDFDKERDQTKRTLTLMVTIKPGYNAHDQLYAKFFRDSFGSIESVTVVES